MNTSWEFITECLRNELQEYGGLLGLYEDQQAALLKRDPDAVLALTGVIEEQVKRSMHARNHRERAVRVFAIQVQQPDELTLRQLMPHFPAEVRPLLQALVDEINHLIHRIRRDARQNQLLLSKAIESHEEALRTLRPEAFHRTYSPTGSVAMGAGTGWQAAG